MWTENYKGLNTLLYILLCMEGYQIKALLYPPSSVIQLVGSISVPVVNLPPSRRIVFDWGFQMNYDMPFALSSFYNVPIWSTTNGSTIRSTRSKEFKIPSVHPRDFTLLELYEAVEGILENYGYRRSCLLLTICELMKFPFDTQQGHIISELLSIFLRPSQHLNIGRVQFNELGAYILAELRGKMGYDCNRFYFDCHKNPLNLISKVSYDSKDL